MNEWSLRHCIYLSLICHLLFCSTHLPRKASNAFLKKKTRSSRHRSLNIEKEVDAVKEKKSRSSTSNYKPFELLPDKKKIYDEHIKEVAISGKYRDVSARRTALENIPIRSVQDSYRRFELGALISAIAIKPIPIGKLVSKREGKKMTGTGRSS